MFIAAAVITVIFALAFGASSISKFRMDPTQLEHMTALGFPENSLYALGTLEVLGATGMLIGLAWWPLGVVAAIGGVLYFVGAIAAQLRVGDRMIVPALVMLVVATAALVLRILSI